MSFWLTIAMASRSQDAERQPKSSNMGDPPICTMCAGLGNHASVNTQFYIFIARHMCFFVLEQASLAIRITC